MVTNESALARIGHRFRGGLALFREYFGLGGKVHKQPVDSIDALQTFIGTRASLIAQTSLYGYLRTRAGQRYPELFDNDEFIVSINIAKWHMWLACLSDLSVFAGGLLAHRTSLSEENVRDVMVALVDRLLAETGTPAEADADFPDHAQRVRQRIALTHWHGVEDGESCFQASQDTLVQRAPIMRELMALDEPIVRNSVRFHWQEIRRELREYLVAEALAAELASNRSDSAATG